MPKATTDRDWQKIEQAVNTQLEASGFNSEQQQAVVDAIMVGLQAYYITERKKHV